MSLRRTTREFERMMGGECTEITASPLSVPSCSRVVVFSKTKSRCFAVNFNMTTSRIATLAAETRIRMSRTISISCPPLTHVSVQGRTLIYDQSSDNLVDGEPGAADHDKSGDVEVQKHQNKELSILVANAVMHPRAMMVHVHDTCAADRAMMASFGFIHVATLAESLTAWVLSLVSLIQRQIAG